MKKFSPYLAALALAVALVLKFAVPAVQDRDAGLRSAGYHEGFAAAKKTYAPVAPKESAAVAAGLCTAQWPTNAVELFDPAYEVTQQELDAYTTNYQSQNKHCDEATFLGSVSYSDGTRDDIYRITIASRELWYIFSITADGLVANIQ